MSIIRIASVALVAVCVSLVIKQVRPELSIYISVTAACVIFIYALSELLNIQQTISDKFAEIGLDGSYIAVLVKSLGIAYVTRLACDICKDAGENAVATKVALFGKVMILSCALPIMLSVLDMIKEVLELI